MFCLCFVYVLFMFCLCFVYALSMFCLCFVYVLFMFCLCFVYVLFMFQQFFFHISQAGQLEVVFENLEGDLLFKKIEDNDVFFSEIS